MWIPAAAERRLGRRRVLRNSPSSPSLPRIMISPIVAPSRGTGAMVSGSITSERLEHRVAHALARLQRRLLARPAARPTPPARRRPWPGRSTRSGRRGGSCRCRARPSSAAPRPAARAPPVITSTRWSNGAPHARRRVDHHAHHDRRAAQVGHPVLGDRGDRSRRPRPGAGRRGCRPAASPPRESTSRCSGTSAGSRDRPGAGPCSQARMSGRSRSDRRRGDGYTTPLGWPVVPEV